MARIAFLSVCERNAHGQRMMSAGLRRQGHECHIVFLKRYGRDLPAADEPGDYPWIGIDKRGREFRYGCGSPVTPREFSLLRALLERIRPDAIGMTVNTPLRKQNAQVARYIRTFSDVPLIWGGYDPTMNPSLCLEHCDYVCRGEGDIAILEIARCLDRGEPLAGVSNLCYRSNGAMVENPRAPLVSELDSLPWRDNTPYHKYFIEDDGLIENYAVLTDRPAGTYQTLTSRGCPYRCSYCCERPLKDLYAGERFLRRRSPSDSVAELAEARTRYGATGIIFEDEIFGVDVNWLREFAPLYRSQVGLPFSAYLYPTRNAGEVLPMLKEAGMSSGCVSLQSGSPRINREIFDRVYDRESFLTTAWLCKALQIDFYTDVITHNPYEEPEDLQQTLAALLDAQGQYGLCINKLFVLPGTPLAERMRRDGKTLDDRSRDDLFDYYCRLFWIASFSRFSIWVVRLVQSVGVFRRRPKLIHVGLAEFFLRAAGWVHRRAQWLGRAAGLKTD